MTDTKHEPESAASHTRGPWEHAGNGLVYGRCRDDEDSEAPLVCDVIADDAMRALGILSPEEEANARLIAAAPKLLAAACHALADLEGILPEFDPSGERGHPAWETVEELRDALAEAKGLAA